MLLLEFLVKPFKRFDGVLCELGPVSLDDAIEIAHLAAEVFVVLDQVLSCGGRLSDLHPFWGPGVNLAGSLASHT